MTDTQTPPKDAILNAAIPHVAFDGWSENTFRAAVAESGVDTATARLAYPRGAIDLAIAFHKRGDQVMASRIAAEDQSDLRYRDKIAAAIRIRLEAVEDVEAVRRGATLFALPVYAAEGARLVWGTADAIWTSLGDTSDDVNWYTKRATLSAVYSATVLFWLGDESPENQATWDFLDRRIEDVMRIEKAKAAARNNPVLSRLSAGPASLIGRIRAPSQIRQSDLPGFVRGTGAE